MLLLKYSAVIIGGGIAGLCTAYHLSNAGMQDILVIDKSSLGGGSTGWASGVITHLFPDRIMINLVKEGVRFYQEIEELTNFEFNQEGMLSVGNSRNSDSLNESHRLLKSAGVKTMLMNEESIRKNFPNILTKDLEVGVFCHESGFIDQSALIRILSSMLKQKGVSITEHTIPRGLMVNGNEVRGVTIGDEVIESERVIISSGVWSKSILAEWIGYQLPLTVFKTQVIQIGVSQPTTIPVFYDLTTGQYGRSIDEQTILLGDGSTEFSGEVDTAGNSGEDSFAKETLADLKARISNIRDPSVLGSWSGLYCTTPDGRPLIGELETIRGLYYICGFQGLGLTLAPGSGKYLAKIIHDKTISRTNPFRAERFAELTNNSQRI